MSSDKYISGGPKPLDKVEAKQRRNRTLLIGINHYEHWNDLNYPVSDLIMSHKI